MRISIFSGPGLGKSTTAGRLFGEMKLRGHNVEMVKEVAKEYAYLNKPIRGFDQWEVFIQQLQNERKYLDLNIDTVTDCPPLLNYYYARKYNVFGHEDMLKLVLEYERQYPAINIYIVNNYKEYNSFGRFQNIDDAKLIHNEIFDLMNQIKWPRFTFSKDGDIKSLYDFILDNKEYYESIRDT